MLYLFSDMMNSSVTLQILPIKTLRKTLFNEIIVE